MKGKIFGIVAIALLSCLYHEMQGSIWLNEVENQSNFFVEVRPTYHPNYGNRFRWERASKCLGGSAFDGKFNIGCAPFIIPPNSGKIDASIQITNQSSGQPIYVTVYDPKIDPVRGLSYAKKIYQLFVKGAGEVALIEDTEDKGAMTTHDYLPGAIKGANIKLTIDNTGKPSLTNAAKPNWN